MNRCSFQSARAILILSALTVNIDQPGEDALWMEVCLGFYVHSVASYPEMEEALSDSVKIAGKNRPSSKLGFAARSIIEC